MPLKFPIQSIRFQPAAGMMLLSALFFVIFVCLGIWQLHRYQYKQELLSNYQQRIRMKPLSIDKLNDYQEKNFLPVKVKGRYENDRMILLQNRMHRHEIGYEVIMPFKIKDKNKILLVNRGWISRKKNLYELSKLASVRGMQTIQGHIKLGNEYQFTLGNDLLNPGHWPLLIQKIDFVKLHQLLKSPLYSFILRLDPNQPNGFIRDWKPLNILPERHLGYAIQWFALSFALIIAFLGFSFRRNKKKDG